MESKPKLDLRELKVDQFGYVFKDIEQQARLWETYFNVPKFNFMPPHIGRVNYRGKETEVTIKIGFSRNFNVQIEFIQLIEGQCIYKEFLDQGREGLQHISCTVENIELQIDQFRKLGYEPVQSGLVFGFRRVAYYEFEMMLGVLFEVQGSVKQSRKKS